MRMTWYNNFYWNNKNSMIENIENKILEELKTKKSGYKKEMVKYKIKIFIIFFSFISNFTKYIFILKN